MRAGFEIDFGQAGVQTLARKFHQAEGRNATDLQTRAVGFHRFFHAAFDGGVVAPVFHIDEIDNDKARQIAQAQLARDFVGGFEIGFQRGAFDIAVRAWRGRN